MTTESHPTVSEQLAKHFLGVKVEAIDSKNISGAKVLLLDYLGVALCGSTTESGRIAAAMAAGMKGVAEATMIGTVHRVPATEAAFANAVASHSLELDDVDKEALFHFGPPVVSAALAAGETMGCSGKDLLTAIVCGCEMMERVSWAANPTLRNRGFHTTAAAGVFGSTIASGKLLGLNESQLVSALGLAGAQASGLMEMYGRSMQKRFNPGPAARNGVYASRLARLGFTGAETIFEGERGYLQAFTGGPGNLDALRPDMKKPYPLEVEYKAYACARPIHPAIDAALSLRPKVLPRLSEITKIEVFRHPMWAHYHTNKEPGSYHEAQVSLPYSVAVALIDGDAFLEQYEKAEPLDAEVRKLMEKVVIVPDDRLPTTVACRVKIFLPGTEPLVSQVDHPKGSIQNPMSTEERRNKFTKLAGRVLTKKEMQTLIEHVEQIETTNNVDSLIRLLRQER